MRISDWSSDVCSSDLFTRAKVCSVSFRGNFFNYCDTIIHDGGESSGSTIMGVFDDTNYITNIGGVYDGFTYRGLMSLTCPRNFMRFDLPFSNNAPAGLPRSEEHTSELQSLMRISYAVFCL